MQKHYYNFTFIDSASGTVLYGNCYLGLPDQRVTLAVIELAAKRARLTEAATMLSCNYLGYMSEEEFRAPLPA